eukprot:scaffold97404_cov19-Tisochrysis_lutea.AAC.2
MMNATQDMQESQPALEHVSPRPTPHAPAPEQGAQHSIAQTSPTPCAASTRFYARSSRGPGVPRPTSYSCARGGC